MFLAIISVMLVASVAVPFAVLVGKGKTQVKFKKALGVNIGGFITTLTTGIIMMFSGSAFAAGETAAKVLPDSAYGMGFLSAAIVTSFACIGAGIAVAVSASAALGAISENEKLTGKALIFVALAEGIALYGLLVAFSILSKL